MVKPKIGVPTDAERLFGLEYTLMMVLRRLEKLEKTEHELNKACVLAQKVEKQVKSYEKRVAKMWRQILVVDAEIKIDNEGIECKIDTITSRIDSFHSFVGAIKRDFEKLMAKNDDHKRAISNKVISRK